MRSKITRQTYLTVVESGVDIIVLDTETTGFSAEKDRVIQISATKYAVPEPGKFVEIGILDEYINPGYEIPPKITEITGITDELLADKPREGEIFEKIFAFLGNNPVVAAYNAAFDIRFLVAMYARNGHKFEPQATLDVLEMSRDLVDKKDVASFKLCEIAKLYGVDNDLTFHNSMDDVTATARLLNVFYREYVEIQEREISTPKKVPVISSMRYWAGYKGYAFIFINTDLGGFHYSIRDQKWGKNKDNPIDIDEVDMEQLIQDAFKKAGAHDRTEFSKYRGS